MYRGQSTRHMGGFTLVELMMVLVIAAVLLAIAAPGFRTLLERNRLETSASNLYASLMLARSEALKRNLPVGVCKGNADDPNNPSCEAGNEGVWDGGWLVHTDPNNPTSLNKSDLLAVREGLAGGDTLRLYNTSTPSTKYNAITFRPDGGASAAVTFKLCNADADTSTGKEIRLNVTGRPARTTSSASCSP